ncbi:hypothetical protein Q5P01_010568 [Channa striata]|uniref:Uncharacterized protein n=1 Tax=Channa striata TaxID=64152 RepID=A0AA88SRX0_CHASR|nr:hypothetical protein Q5P01_010568 [Channa striata]
MIGRVLLSEADGISRFVYPTLSLSVHQNTCKEINKVLINFVWKNKRHHLKNEILAGSWAEGVELLDFGDLNYTFKIKCIKECLKAPNSLWYFIPVNVFEKMGGLQFLLLCDYDVTKLPQNQQTLTAAKLCFVHNFSPHETIIWNNEYITRKNKSLYLQKWMDKNIIYLSDIQSETGQLLSYEEF